MGFNYIFADKRKCDAELTTANAMLASAARQKQTLVDSINFLVLSTYSPRRKAPSNPNTVNNAPFRPAKNYRGIEMSV